MENTRYFETGNLWKETGTVDVKEDQFYNEGLLVKKILQNDVPIFLGSKEFLPLCREYPTRDAGIDLIALQEGGDGILLAEFKCRIGTDKKAKTFQQKDFDEAMHRPVRYQSHKIESIQRYVQSCCAIGGGLRHDLVRYDSSDRIKSYLGRVGKDRSIGSLGPNLEVGLISNFSIRTQDYPIWQVSLRIERDQQGRLVLMSQCTVAPSKCSEQQRWALWELGSKAYQKTLRGETAEPVNKDNQRLGELFEDFPLRPRFNRRKHPEEYSVLFETKNDKRSIGYIKLRNGCEEEIAVDPGFIDDGQSYGVDPAEEEYLRVREYFLGRHKNLVADSGYLVFNKTQISEVIRELGKLLRIYNSTS